MSTRLHRKTIKKAYATTTLKTRLMNQQRRAAGADGYKKSLRQRTTLTSSIVTTREVSYHLVGELHETVDGSSHLAENFLLAGAEVYPNS